MHWWLRTMAAAWAWAWCQTQAVPQQRLLYIQHSTHSVYAPWLLMEVEHVLISLRLDSPFADGEALSLSCTIVAVCHTVWQLANKASVATADRGFDGFNHFAMESRFQRRRSAMLG